MTNLAVYLQSAWEAISDGYQTDAIYTDYSAAFQSVNHSLLIHKLKHSYKLEEFALKWFVSYLSDRRQRVIVNGKTSKWTTVLSGVPEGSLLAPLLFSLFINDLPREVDSGCLLYADDVKIFRKIVSPADGLLLQEDLNRLTAWSVRWGPVLEKWFHDLSSQNKFPWKWENKMLYLRVSYFFKIWKAKLSELSNLPQPQPLFNGTAVGLRGTSQHM